MSGISWLPRQKPKRSRHNLSHVHKLSIQMGRLYPVICEDCVPGDSFVLGHEALLRMAPMTAPLMDTVQIKVEYFFVPNRLLWPDWEKWIAQNYEPGSLSVPLAFVDTDAQVVNLSTYLGYPVVSGYSYAASAFPPAAYALIWDEYYRDQNFQDSIFQPLTSGSSGNGWLNSILNERPLKRAWGHDYFTSCLPFPQAGEDVVIPVNSNIAFQTQPPGARSFQRDPTTGAIVDGSDSQLKVSPTGQNYVDPEGDITYTAYDPAGTLTGSPTDESTINTLRRAFALQRWLEIGARFGRRYIEFIAGHFGVTSSDARLQRPEFIGMTKGYMSISEVLSTADTTVPVGNLAGHGISVNKSPMFRYDVEEHGWIIGLLSVQPQTSYQQGLPKRFNRTDQFDYLFPAFANIGEQAVLNSELYMTNDAERNNGTFGYLPRYSEYRDRVNRVSGEFQTELNDWHMGRIFSSPPDLNASFIESNPTTRIFAVTDTDIDNIYVQFRSEMYATRPIPKYGVPNP